ncbi:MAG: serine/threonine protein kinase [Frankiales bacterium]|nr:serine/threonine protein kinase [Frankiales bacterium]
MQPGQRTLAGRYELLALLATGGMGQVWRARDVVLGRPVAVKVLRSEYTGDPTFLARFRAEAQHTARLTHRNIATLYDYGEVAAGEGAEEHLAYLVMELVEGEPLSTLLARERRLSVPATLDLLHQTASALAAAHAAGVIHRDVKPGNVLMGSDGVVKITDFGIAWSASDVPLTQTGQVVGTAHYLSPEQADGGKASPASDVYALGMIGYECLAGRRAFDGDNAVQIALRQIKEMPQPLPADVPVPVRSLIGRALLKDPDERFTDGAEFRDAVAAVLDGRGLPPPPLPLLPMEPRTTPLALRGRVEPPPHASGPGWRRALAPVATLAAGAVIGIGALQFFGTSDPAAPAAAGSSAAGSSATGNGATGVRSVDLVAAGYVGRPVREVEASLVALGLRVTLVPTETPGVAPDLVLAVAPGGGLHAGDSVTVTYAVAPAPAPSSTSSPGGSGDGRTATEVAMTPAPAPAPAAGTGTGGAGHGHGRNKGGGRD